MKKGTYVAQILIAAAFMQMSCSGESKTSTPDAFIDSSVVVDIGFDLGVQEDGEIYDSFIDERVVCGEPGEMTSWTDIESLRGCEVFLGSISIVDYTGDGEDLSAASSLQEVNNLSLFRGSIDSLSAFSNLKRINGFFSIRFNNSISNFEGLDSLEYVEGVFEVEGNSALTSMKGLSSIESSGGLTIEFNSALESINEMTSYNTVRGDLIIAARPSLPQPQVDQFVDRVHIEGDIDISP